MKRGSADPPRARRVPVAQTMVQKLLGVHDGIPDPEAKPQIGRNGGGQRATRAVVVRGLHSRLLQRDERFVRQSQPIREFGGGGRAEMPPLMRTALGPISRSLRAATSMSFSESIFMSASSSASGRLGVRRSALGRMCQRKALTASSRRSRAALA